jgi:hypothetical protein
MKKEVARMSRSVPAARTGGDDPDGYAGMPIVIYEEPEWSTFMAPETAKFGTGIQRWYRIAIVPVRGTAYLMKTAGELILRGTQYWYTAALIVASAVTLLIIFVTR